MAQGQSIIVDIFISADEFLRHYNGSVHTVSCVSRDGKRIQFPSRILQPFVTREGVRGSFKIYFDAQHKFSKIERLL